MCPPANIESNAPYQSITLDQRFELAQLQKQHEKKYPFLLETSSHSLNSTVSGGFDILFALPQETLCLKEGVLAFDDNFLDTTTDSDKAHVDHGTDNNDPIDSEFLLAFDKWWQTHHTEKSLPDNIPYAGGWFVYLGYELAQEVEPVLILPKDESNFPTAFATRCPAAIIYDHKLNQTTIIAETGFEQYLDKIQRELLESQTNINDMPVSGTQCMITACHEDPPQQYKDSVNRIKKYITEGDVFQVNLSRLWKATTKNYINHIDLYHQLKRFNPAPFSGLVCTPYGSIISSSPERLVSSHQGNIQTRPIAGTRPRATDENKDAAFAEELMIHPKEIAEHIMLVDLERNDLGRVCVPGSIKVNDLMSRESYAKVHHIVSNVIGKIRPGVRPAAILKAVFPGGTITGCPKVRCMQIIAELEKTGRGPYTGSMGYINYNGKMDFNILIRTFQLQGQNLLLRAGAGIVHDSIADNELDETRAKAAAMLEALGSDLLA